jgi:transglutaminase-like putative cysteine protease
MILRVEHTTEFHYDGPIAEAYTELRLRPLEGGGQHCSSFRLITEPFGLRVRDYRDHLGNDVHHFDVLESHERLAITAVSEVMTPAWFTGDRRQPTPLELYDFLSPTGYTPFAGAVVELAKGHAAAGSGFERASGLMAAVRGELRYEPGATDVQTRADEVLALGRGVCQDFAHVMLACLRSHGLPARYVSGYLLTQPPPGRPRLLGADVSHAWVAAYSPRHGWVEFDPTNDQRADRRYITLATGADFADVVPLRGVILGGRGQAMKVAVSVVPRPRA